MYRPEPLPLVEQIEGLREFYPADNEIGLMLDELAKDLRSDAPRDEVASDARDLLTRIDRTSTAFKMIGAALTALASPGDD